MLGWRVLISAIVVPSLLGLFYADARLGPTAPVFLVLCVLLALRGAWELTALLTVRVSRPQFRLVAPWVATVVAAGWWPHVAAVQVGSPPVLSLAAIAMVVSLGVLFLFLSGAMRYRAPGMMMETLGAELLILNYTGLLLAVTAQLRWVAGPEAGYLVLGSLLLAAKCGDIGAYTLGRMFGKRKMVPLLSPGKTWMGAWGAMIASALAGWAWLTWATPLFDESWTPPPFYWSGLYGVLIGVTGLIGDLCESLIKRDVGQKDSAPLLPGFGGILDLLDSVIYAGPVAYVLWLVLPLRTW